MGSGVLQDIVAVRHLGGHRLWLRFEDGVEGEVDLRDVIEEFPGVLAALLDPAFVARVRVHPEFGTITWPGELDLDPVVLYCAVRGVPVPTYEKPVARRRRAANAGAAQGRRSTRARKKSA